MPAEVILNAGAAVVQNAAIIDGTSKACRLAKACRRPLTISVGLF